MISPKNPFPWAIRNQIFTFRPVQLLQLEIAGTAAGLCPLTDTAPKSFA